MSNNNLRKYIIVTPIVVFVLVIGMVIGMRIKNTINFVDTQQAADMLARATDNVTYDAPVDPRTGDSYFPVIKVYMPAAKDYQSDYTYFASSDYKTEDSSLVALVSRRAMINEEVNRLYNGFNAEVVFERFPTAQACTRAVLMSTSQIKEAQDYTLTRAQGFADGKMLYTYYHTNCPSAQDLSDELKAIQAY